MKEHKHNYILLKDPYNLNGCYILFCETCMYGTQAKIGWHMPQECVEPEIDVSGGKKWLNVK